MVIIFPTGSEVRGFKPGRGRWFFSERKNPVYNFLRREVKPWVPCRRFPARKKPEAEIRAFKHNLSDFSRSMSKATLMA